MVVYKDGVAYTHGGVMPVILCKWCGSSTHFLGTKMCDRCYELESRIEADLELAERMVKEISSRQK